jgi:hypothetical protein
VGQIIKSAAVSPPKTHSYVKAPIRGVISAALLLGWNISAALADLPPDAQSSVDQQLAAIQKQDYVLAWTYFQEACRRADAADVYSTLGQAEAKIPGRELRAICWLGAYLAEKPSAPDVAIVRNQMDAMHIRIQDRILALVQFTQQATQEMPEGQDRDYALRSVASLGESLGNLLRPERSSIRFRAIPRWTD